jgi:hypothetical protein
MVDNTKGDGTSFILGVKAIGDSDKNSTALIMSQRESLPWETRWYQWHF